MNVYRIFRRRKNSDDQFVPTSDTKLYTHLATAQEVVKGIQVSNDRWHLPEISDNEYRLFAVRVTDEQFIPVS